MSQAHVDALLIARDTLENFSGSRFTCLCLPYTGAANEIERAIRKSLEGCKTLDSWLASRGIDCGDPITMRKTRLAWIDQMIIDWKDAP